MEGIDGPKGEGVGFPYLVVDEPNLHLVQSTGKGCLR